MLTPSQIYEAVWAVLNQWRPGMSDEVKDTLSRSIADRIAKLSEGD